jgi:hypothetical protein
VKEIDYLVVFLTAMTMAICARMIQRTLSEKKRTRRCFEILEVHLMNKRTSRQKKASRRSERLGRSGAADKVGIAKSPDSLVKEKDEPIKCASPPCYLSEIED